MNLDGTSCVPALWAARVETPTYRDLFQLEVVDSVLSGRFEPAEDAADWCLNIPLLDHPCPAIPGRTNPFKGRPRGERDLVLSCSTATLLPNLQLASSFFHCALTAGVPARSGLCGERWGSLPPVPHHTFPIGPDPSALLGHLSNCRGLPSLTTWS